MSYLLRSSVSRKITIACKCADSPPFLDFDMTMLWQLLQSLLVNAAEAIGEEEGDITIVTGTRVCDRDFLSNGSLQAGLEEGEYAFLTVADTGCGMAEDAKKKMFDPFFSTKASNRGMGMATAFGIVRSGGGDIFVQSKVDHGSEITVILPAVSPPTILVVDDEEKVLKTTAQMIERIGYSVLTVTNGRDAVSLFQKRNKSIDLVILDIVMPKLNGIETFHMLQSIDKDVRVLFASGYSDSVFETKFEGPAPPLLQKPYRIDALKKKIGELLGR